jgi:phenylalanyl-tRNA synthetase beta chain
MCVIADGVGEGEEDGARPIGLGGVMGGASTGCTEETTDVFIESAWFDPHGDRLDRAAAGHQLRRPVPLRPRGRPRHRRPRDRAGTAMILELCGGEPSEVLVAGTPLPRPAGFDFDPEYVHKLTALSVGRQGSLDVLSASAFNYEGRGATVFVYPPSGAGTWKGRRTWWRKSPGSSATAPCPLPLCPRIEPRPAAC